VQGTARSYGKSSWAFRNDYIGSTSIVTDVSAPTISSESSCRLQDPGAHLSRMGFLANPDLQVGDPFASSTSEGLNPIWQPALFVLGSEKKF
jgi:hypothetical protein